jgi:hypothetical protein
VAQHGPFAAGKERSLFDRELRRDVVTHQIHAAMKLMQPPALHAHVDLATRDTSAKQLPTRNDAVLPGRESRD